MANTGALYPGAATLNSSVGTVNWQNSDSGSTSDAELLAAIASGTPYVYGNTAGTVTKYLKCTNFGASITAGNSIDGIEVFIAGYRDGSTFTVNVRLVIGGTITGNTLTSSNFSGFPPTQLSVGGSTELWGTTPTRDNVVASDFGIVISGTGDAAIRMLYGGIVIYYSTPVVLPGVTGMMGQVF